MIPLDIKLIYLFECGFYMHSVYATLFMDTLRNDLAAMLLHHFVTIFLISFSYGTGYYKIGLIVLFMHDVADILLEFSKCNMYLKHRNGQLYKIHETLANITFLTLTVVWFVFRLYWFPLKVLYSTGVVSLHKMFHLGGKMYGLLNFLLWTLLVLNIYWYYVSNNLKYYYF